MRKIVCTILCISLIASLFILPVSATGSEWYVNSKGYVTGYTGTESVLVIPDTISGVTVTGIGESAFEMNTRIREITLPETCTFIDNYAFKNCSKLNTINAPGVTTVKQEAFWRCRKLDYVNMPKLNKLSRRCFMSCGELNNLPVENFTTLPAYAFAYCKFTEITFPNVTETYNNVFSGCTNLVEVSLPSIQDGCLGENAFSHCQKLERVNFPDDFVSLGGSTFAGCSNIKDFSFLENIEYVYMNDFYNCNAVESITLPEVQFVDSRTFSEMYFLKEVYLPSCTTVFQEAFYKNRFLEKIVFSGSLEFVGLGAFTDNSSLKYVVLNGLENSSEAIFEGSSIERVEFNKIKSVASLPVFENSAVALPSTFRDCTEDTTGRNYRVYGTKGSYAERWAVLNGHSFYEISQENSIVADVPVVFDVDSDDSILFDAIGFNSYFEWYGSFDKTVNNDDDVLIKGSNSNKFKPEKENKYPYYYCKMTSSDYDAYGELVSEVEIYSSICEIYSSTETEIDLDNKLVYTNDAENVNLTDILYVEEDVSFELTPSYVCEGSDYYGTGSIFNLYEDGNVVNSYTVIMKADINGDGVIDALDASGIEKEMNSRQEFTGNYYLAADSNRDQIVDIVDYQTAVNMAIS